MKKFADIAKGKLNHTLETLIQYAQIMNVVSDNKVKKVTISVQCDFDGFEISVPVDRDGNPIKEAK